MALPRTALTGNRQDLSHKAAQIAGLSGVSPALPRTDAEFLILAHDRPTFRPNLPLVPLKALKILAFTFRAARASTNAPAPKG